MKALTWHGKADIRCETVPDPRIEDGRDAIIKVTACAICGSDLHIYGGLIPSMEKGDIVGHESMGEVVEVGPENKTLKIGDRVVVPFTISCGEGFFCKQATTPPANGAIRTSRGPRSYGAILRRDCWVILTCWADFRAGKPNTCACRSPMWVRSRCPII